jgi:hypothetical protein
MARGALQRRQRVRRVTAHICRSRPPCEYAERARTRAQIICARMSGRRAVGIAPDRHLAQAGGPTSGALIDGSWLHANDGELSQNRGRYCSSAVAGAWPKIRRVTGILHLPP